MSEQLPFTLVLLTMNNKQSLILPDYLFYISTKPVFYKTTTTTETKHYDDETVTFSQLLVKAHRNEEEETTSKLINKSAVADSTLEERVDRFIERSNQFNEPNPGPSRDNRDNSHNQIQISQKLHKGHKQTTLHAIMNIQQTRQEILLRR